MIQKSLLQVNKLSFSYKKSDTFLKNISFSVDEGSIVMIIGPNGSGKTTLLKTMIGLLKPQSGTILLDGKAPAQARPIISYVPQHLDFDKTFPLTVFEFLQFSYASVSENMIKDLLAELDIADIKHSLIGNLSGGQLQRVLIARSLLNIPKILFLDEPVSGIDVGGEEDFYELIKRIQKQRHLTVMMVSHEVHLVNKFADYVICINKNFLCSGKPEEILSSNLINRMYGKSHKPYNHSC